MLHGLGDCTLELNCGCLTDTTPALVQIVDADSLREHLDQLNESGTQPVVAGMDADKRPFLCFLTGIYADSEEVLFDNPWDVETKNDLVCGQECEASGSAQLSALKFPVHVITQTSRI